MLHASETVTELPAADDAYARTTCDGWAVHLVDLLPAFICCDSEGIIFDALVEGGREQQKLHRLLGVSPEIPHKPHRV